MASLVFPALSAFGAYTTLKASISNGFFNLLDKISHGTNLPDTRHPFIKWTGFDPLDGLLTGVVSFFYQVADGSDPAAALQAFRFSGIFVGLYTLMALEGSRKGNWRKFGSRIWLWGLLIQHFSAAVTVPLWCLVSVLSMKSASSWDVLPSRGSGTAIPLAVAHGFILPIVAIGLLAPKASASSEASFHTQLALVFFQFFPVTVSVLQSLSGPFVRTVFPKSRDMIHDGIASLSAIYNFTIAVSAIPHFLSVAVSVLSLASPSYLPASLEAHSSAFNPAVWFIPAFRDNTPVHTVSQGAFWFMQWDEIVSSTAIVAWAVMQRCNAGHSSPKPNMLWISAKATGLSLLLSPAGAAAILLWERDFEVLAGESGGRNVNDMMARGVNAGSAEKIARITGEDVSGRGFREDLDWTRKM